MTDEEKIFYISREKRVSKLFSLRFNPDNIDDLLLRRTLSKPYIDLYKQLWEILEDIAPGRGDVQFGFQANFKTHVNSYGSNHTGEFVLYDGYRVRFMYIVVRFPEFEIINSQDDAVKIKDLFVRIPIDIYDPLSRTRAVDFEKIQGVRTTVTPQEAASSYVHSHLKTRDYARYEMEYDDFCTGSDTDINLNTALVNSESNGTEYLKLLIMQLEQFVRWESIEGTPYISMSKIAQGVAEIDQLHVDAPVFNQATVFLIRAIDDNGLQVEADWNYDETNHTWKIIDNEKFEDFLTVALLYKLANYFYYKNERGEYVRGTRAMTRASLRNSFTKWLPFRREKVFFQLEGEFSGLGTNRKQYIHPKIKEHVQQYLESKANLYHFRESRIKRGHYFSYT